MAAGTQDRSARNISEVVAAFNHVASALPILTENIANFYRNLKAYVDELLESLGTIKHRHVTATTEARAICDELVKMIGYTNDYMAMVDNFAKYAKNKNRQKTVLQKALAKHGRGRTTAQPTAALKEYISQLVRKLSEAEESYQKFVDSFKGIMPRLQSVLGDCGTDVIEIEKNKLSTEITAIACGAVLAASMAGASSFGTGTVMMLLLTAAAGTGVTAGVITRCMAKKYTVLEDAVKALAERLRILHSSAHSIHTAIQKVRVKLVSVSKILDEVEVSYNIPNSLMESLKLLFKRFVEVGTECSKCHQTTKEEKESLGTVFGQIFEMI